MKKIINLSVITIFLLPAVSGCADMPEYDAAIHDNIAPGQVTVTEVRALPGGSVIKYTLPSDDDLLGVIVHYSYRDDSEQLEQYVSIFSDSVVTEGFPDTKPRIVQLITVDKSKNRSAPVPVTVNPDASPLELIRSTLKASAGFGSVVVSWQNSTRTNVGVFLHTEDDSTGLATDLNYYSKEEHGYCLFKGFDNRQRNFNIQIKDRWDNYSESLDTVLQPRLKIKIPSMDGSGYIWNRYGFADGSSKWRGDLSTHGGSNIFNNMFDGNMSTFYGAGVNNIPNTYIPGSGTQELVPLYFTIDLGRPSVLCEHVLWHDRGNELGGQNLKSYELWATNETPKQPSDFPSQEASLAYWTGWSVFGGVDAWKTEGGWVKIADCITTPNSGSTAPTVADKSYAAENGFVFEIFPEHTGATFRYVRVVSRLPMWNGGTNPRIAEFELYGSQ
ncbi:MAG: DUF4959 domain-containing protein [Tannerella sp.]|nr:DUF4959 domain-containing protein [Tannerella sp.]